MLQTDTARSENAVMHSLLAEAFEAHGGLERWRGFSALSATIVTGGEFWAMKGLVQDSDPRRVTVELRREWGSLAPFGNPDWHTDFTPDRIAILDRAGNILAERRAPRAAFAGHDLTTPWDPLHRAYFNGYALWTYLNTPFVLAEPGFAISDIPALTEGGKSGADSERHSPTASRRIAANRISTSGPTACCVATIITLTSPAGSPRFIWFPTSSTSGAFACRHVVAPINATRISAPGSTG